MAELIAGRVKTLDQLRTMSLAELEALPGGRPDRRGQHSRLFPRRQPGYSMIWRPWKASPEPPKRQRPRRQAAFCRQDLRYTGIGYPTIAGRSRGLDQRAWGKVTGPVSKSTSYVLTGDEPKKRERPNSWAFIDEAEFERAGRDRERRAAELGKPRRAKRPRTPRPSEWPQRPFLCDLRHLSSGGHRKSWVRDRCRHPRCRWCEPRRAAWPH